MYFEKGKLGYVFYHMDLFNNADQNICLYTHIIQTLVFGIEAPKEKYLSVPFSFIYL